MQLQYLKNKLYQNNCSVFHVGSYMKKTIDDNGQVIDRLVSLVFKNISEKNITAVEGIIYNYNAFHDLIGETSFKLIEIPDLFPTVMFGETVFFKVYNEAIEFEVEVKRIKYQSNEVDNYNDISFDKLIDSDNLTNSKEKNYVLNKEFNDIEYVMDLDIKESYYYCLCGQMNKIQNQKCINCKIEKEKYSELCNIQNVKKIIHLDSLEYYNNIFNDTNLTFDLNEIEIEALINEEGYKSIKKSISNEINRFEKLDEALIERLNEVYNLSSNFKKISELLNKVQKSIDLRKKVQKRLERSNKLAEEKAEKELEEKRKKQINIELKQKFESLNEEINNSDIDIAFNMIPTDNCELLDSNNEFICNIKKLHKISNYNELENSLKSYNYRYIYRLIEEGRKSTLDSKNFYEFIKILEKSQRVKKNSYVFKIILLQIIFVFIRFFIIIIDTHYYINVDNENVTFQNRNVEKRINVIDKNDSYSDIVGSLMNSSMDGTNKGLIVGFFHIPLILGIFNVFGDWYNSIIFISVILCIRGIIYFFIEDAKIMKIRYHKMKVPRYKN